MKQCQGKREADGEFDGNGRESPPKASADDPFPALTGRIGYDTLKKSDDGEDGAGACQRERRPGLKALRTAARAFSFEAAAGSAEVSLEAETRM